MKKILSLMLAASFSIAAFSGPVERIYVSTDRSVYLAGEPVFCSLFCLDASASTAVYSTLSSVAYLELAAEGVDNVTAKISLLSGRGSGYMLLPQTLPTGNYRLYAYTTANRNEDGKDYLAFSKVISVFNTTSRARARDGVSIVPEEEFKVEERPLQRAGEVELVVNRSARPSSVFPVTIIPGKAGSVSVSVYCDDGIPAPASPSISDFKDGLSRSAGATSSGSFVPDYDGEILYAKLVGNDWKSVASDEGLTAFISSSGELADVYASSVGKDGSMVFYTNNIYGDRELICEVCGTDSGYRAHMRVESPFIYVEPEKTAPLALSPAMRESLRSRNLALRSNLSVGLDTLSEFLPTRVSQLIAKKDCKVYHLDDYTRFPTMEEVCVEIVRELRITGRKNSRAFSILCTDPSSRQYAFRSNVLTLLDGVPMTDQSRLISLDAMLISDIELYLQPYFLGNRIFSGVVNFVTTRNTVTAIRFSDQTRVFDFKGVSFPVALTAKNIPAPGNDLRQTLYWHPAVTLEKGMEKRIEVRTPSFEGRFRVVVEGLDTEGNPIYSEASFEVR